MRWVDRLLGTEESPEAADVKVDTADPYGTGIDIDELSETLSREEKERLAAFVEETDDWNEYTEAELLNVFDAYSRFEGMLKPSVQRSDYEVKLDLGRVLRDGQQPAAADAETTPLIEDVLHDTVPGLQSEWRLLRENPIASNYKATYIDADNDWIVHAPKADTVRDRFAQVLTWEHNRQQIEAHFADAAVETAADYDVIVQPVSDEPYPVMIGAYNDDVIDIADVREQYGEEKHQEVYERAKDTAAELEELIRSGRMMSAEPNDYLTNNGRIDDLAYDPASDTIVVMDLGELSDALYLRNPGAGYGSTERFLEAHGIDERLSACMDRYT